jgi:hypothetical protein
MVDGSPHFNKSEWTNYPAKVIIISSETLILKA